MLPPPLLAAMNDKTCMEETCFAKEALLKDIEAVEKATSDILARETKAAQARKELEARIRNARDAKLLLDHTGFSLDPGFDYAGLAKWFDESAKSRLLQLASPGLPPSSQPNVMPCASGSSRE